MAKYFNNYKDAVNERRKNKNSKIKKIKGKYKVYIPLKIKNG